MNRRLLLVLSLAAVVAVHVKPVAAWDWLWAHQIVSTVFIDAYGGATDTTGVYVSGRVGADAYVRKLDHSGAVLWTRRFGTTAFDDSAGVASDADAAYITGRTCGTFPGQVQTGICDIYVAKLSSDGDMLWLTQFGTARFDQPYQYGAIAVDASGVYIAGKTDGTFPGATPAGGANTFLARVDRGTGALLWVRQFGLADPSFFSVGGIGVDDTGVAVAATSIALDGRHVNEVRKYTIDGSLQWSRVFDQDTAPCGHAVFGLASHRGHVYVIGQTYEWSLTNCEVQPLGQSYIIGLLQNLDENGNTAWQRRIKAGIPGAEGGSGKRFTGAKVVHVTDQGIFVGANVKYVDFAGWVSRVPRSDSSECGGDPGPVENAVFRRFDGYVRRYDLDGNVLWTHQFGSSFYELVSGLGSEGTQVYAVGMTRCVVEEGIDPEIGAPVDAFVVSFAIDPTTPAGRVQLIVGQIETLSDANRISSGDFTALVSHLESGLAALDRSETNVAKSSLLAFVTLVNNYRITHRLTTHEAEALIDAASGVADDL